MPACLITQNNSVGVLRDIAGYFLQMQLHGLRIAPGHDERSTFTVFRADRAEYPGRTGPLIHRR